ncbi:MAG: hypothetical protein WC116_09900 [Thermovirgaceae bacterium]
MDQKVDESLRGLWSAVHIEAMRTYHRRSCSSDARREKRRAIMYLDGYPTSTIDLVSQATGYSVDELRELGKMHNPGRLHVRRTPEYLGEYLRKLAERRGK